jgi:hypothetical protein
MKHLMLLTGIIGTRTFAQDFINIEAMRKFNYSMMSKVQLAKELKEERAREVMQDNEYTATGHEKGIFVDNPLMLNGQPLDYSEFNLQSAGELTVSKGAAITGQTTQVPFYVYLRRDGNKILIPGQETPDPTQIKIDISEILRYAEFGDQLVIEAVNKEDGAVKRILKIRRGC